jgi:hypothetical protein
MRIYVELNMIDILINYLERDMIVLGINFTFLLHLFWIF